jgi:hypothetical protein
VSGTTDRVTASGWRPGRGTWIALVAVVVLVALVLAGRQVLSSRAAAETERVGTCAVRVNPGLHAATHCPAVDWAGRDLGSRDLRFADLADADLSGADLQGTILFGADLQRADLRGADLTGADLTGTKLTDAQLAEARFDGAYIEGMDVSGTIVAPAPQQAWTTAGDGPARLSWSSQTPTGFTTNTCAEGQQLFTPGQTPIDCRLSTGTRDGQATEYQVVMTVLQAPTVTVPPAVIATVGQSVTIPVQATSPYPVVDLTVFDTPLPDGLTWDPVTQQITGVPTAAAVGMHAVAFRAENGMATTATFTITVQPAVP